MSNVLLCIVILLAIWYEWELAKTALQPLLDAIVCVGFAVLCLICAVVELCLIVIAPVALLFGKESRDWHHKVLLKMTFNGGKKRDD